MLDLLFTLIETFAWILRVYEKYQFATIKIGHLGYNSASKSTNSADSHAHHDGKRCQLSLAQLLLRKKCISKVKSFWTQRLMKGLLSESTQKQVHLGLMYFSH